MRASCEHAPLFYLRMYRKCSSILTPVNRIGGNGDSQRTSQDQYFIASEAFWTAPLTFAVMHQKRVARWNGRNASRAMRAHDIDQSGWNYVANASRRS